VDADEETPLTSAESVAVRRNVGGVSRAAARALALVWVCAGIAAIAIGFAYGEVLLTELGLFAVFYAVLWVRVMARSRVLTWRGLIAPWHAE